MKKLSFWARGHKSQSRILIILSFAFLNVVAVVIGILLNDLHVIVPLSGFYLMIILYFAGIFYYPLKANKRKLSSATFYRRQKISDIILAASALGMMICISNDHIPGIRVFNELHASTPTSALPSDSAAKNYKSIADFSSSLKDVNGKSLSWKEKKKLLKVQVNGIKKAKDMSEGGKIALIVLSVVVAVGLLALVAALACNLSCSGSDAAAILVGVGGTALVIFLLVLVIKAISGKNRKIKQKKEEPMPAN